MKHHDDYNLMVTKLYCSFIVFCVATRLTIIANDIIRGFAITIVLLLGAYIVCKFIDMERI